MELNPLHARLLAEAREYDPAQHNRSLLGPYRDVLLLQRAKFMSYEQIAATLTRHGVRVSPAAVGCFCRRHFTKAEIEALRKKQETTLVSPGGPATVLVAPARPGAKGVAPVAGKRGPKIARDDF